MKRTFLTAAIGICFLLPACDTDEEEPQSPLPVLEAWINSGASPEALLTTSIPAGDTTSLREHLLTWARVTISDGEHEAVMTGGPQQNFLPPFRYRTSEITGRPGRTYTIRATFGPYAAEASCTMPELTPIDAIEVSRIEGDTLYAMQLTFTAPADVPAYYYISIEEGGAKGQPLPSMMGAVMAEAGGQRITLPVFRPRVIGNDSRYRAHFSKGERMIVRLNRVQPEVYRFWRLFSDQTMFGTNDFISTSESLPSNISGGLGIFSAQGSDARLVEIE